jgi:hypothetical protein
VSRWQVGLLPHEGPVPPTDTLISAIHHPDPINVRDLSVPVRFELAVTNRSQQGPPPGVRTPYMCRRNEVAQYRVSCSSLQSPGLDSVVVEVRLPCTGSVLHVCERPT